jgi:hypothetical protein
MQLFGKRQPWLPDFHHRPILVNRFILGTAPGDEKADKSSENDATRSQPAHNPLPSACIWLLFGSAIWVEEAGS